MKTKIRKHYRYQNVLSRNDQVAKQLMNLMGMTPDEYYLREFENGMELLESYFNDSEGATKYKKILAEEKKHNYWPHYRLGRRQCEVEFWNQYKHVYEDQQECFSPEECRAALIAEWEHEMQAYNESDETHERLRHHILQCKISV